MSFPGRTLRAGGKRAGGGAAERRAQQLRACRAAVLAALAAGDGAGAAAQLADLVADAAQRGLLATDPDVLGAAVARAVRAVDGGAAAQGSAAAREGSDAAAAALLARVQRLQAALTRGAVAPGEDPSVAVVLAGALRLPRVLRLTPEDVRCVGGALSYAHPPQEQCAKVAAMGATGVALLVVRTRRSERLRALAPLLGVAEDRLPVVCGE